MDRKVNTKEKSISISIFYLKYIMYMIISILLICIIDFLFFYVLINLGLVYPANYAEKQIKNAQGMIEDADTITEDLIPDLCQYVVFGLDGNVKAANMGENNIKEAWDAVNGKYFSSLAVFYKVIKRKNEYCVLRYKIIPQYTSSFLRKYLLPPQTLLSISLVIFILASVIAVSIRFGCVFKNKLTPLILTAQEIQNQNLDFSVGTVNIKEVNDVLEAMDKMRSTLKYSLESQWKAEQMRKEQISALSHDLKTPLSIIRGNAELLYDTSLTEEQAEYIAYIEESSLKMQDYIKMLIEITKSDNLASPEFQETSIDSFAQDIKEQAERLCLVNNIKLQWIYKCGEEKIYIDKNLLERAIINVLLNATEYSPQEGTITFEIYYKDESVVFSVSDMGKGFNDETLKYAKIQFYMEDSSRSSKIHYGIGLYFADTVVKQHGGSLVLKNLEGQSGARVIISIPLEQLLI